MVKQDKFWEKLTLPQYFMILGFIVLAILPILRPQEQHPFLINTVMWTFFYAYMASSWNLMAGYIGIYSFGHTVFMGVGAYTTAMLYKWYGLSPWIGMLVGALLCGFMSLAMGLPSLRLKGHYFVFLTVAFNEAVRFTTLAWRDLTRGGEGWTYPTPLPEFSWVDFQFNINRTPYYYIMFIMLILNLYFIFKLRQTKYGYYFVSIREDDLVAEVSGVNVTKYKLICVLFSALMTSFGGAFYAQYVLFVEPATTMSLLVMTKLFMPAALGGIGTVFGPVIGSFILIPIGEYVRTFLGYIQGLHFIVFGIILVFVAMVMPHGILGSLDRFSRANKRGSGFVATLIGRTPLFAQSTEHILSTQIQVANLNQDRSR